MKLFKKAFLKAMTGLLLIGILVGCEDLITAGSITEYISVVVCFIAFLVNDIYGYISWQRMKRRQTAE